MGSPVRMAASFFLCFCPSKWSLYVWGPKLRNKKDYYLGLWMGSNRNFLKSRTGTRDFADFAVMQLLHTAVAASGPARSKATRSTTSVEVSASWFGVHPTRGSTWAALSTRARPARFRSGLLVEVRLGGVEKCSFISLVMGLRDSGTIWFSGTCTFKRIKLLCFTFSLKDWFHYLQDLGNSSWLVHSWILGESHSSLLWEMISLNKLKHSSWWAAPQRCVWEPRPPNYY